ncbi:MAG: hypothetical protein WBX22_19960 [Silvibacterium sp.]|jgi:hypothetical protein
MAAAYFTCTVIGAQADSSGPTVSIGLTDTAGAFANTFFPVAAGMPREMLAIALAAISTGSQVLVVLDPTTSGPVVLLQLFT